MQVAETRIRGAEVIERDRHPELRKLMQVGARSLRVHEQGRFGNLDLQPVRRKIRGGERLAHERRNVGAFELGRRDIDGHGGIAGPAPAFEAGLVQDLVADLDDQPHFLGDGDEFRRRHHSAFAVRPAQQRLAGHDALGFQIEQRLVVELERFALQRVAQIQFKIAARQGVGFHLGLEPAPRAAALGLRPIQRHVGVAQELVRVERGGGQRDSDAGGDHYLVAIEIVGAADRVEHARGERLALLEGKDRRLQNDELVAAEARDHVGVANGALQPLGDRLQQHVAAGMPQGVVDLLELVEVDEVDSAHVVRPPLAQRPLHAVAQDGAVGQHGQRIEAGQMIDLGLGDFSLGDAEKGAALERLANLIGDIVAPRDKLVTLRGQRQ